MNNTQKDFLDAINLSFIAYNKKGGARSPKKLIPIHKFLSEEISDRIGKNFIIKSLGIGDGKEARFEGKYYPKRLDVAIFKKGKIIATVSFKFVTSNYKQNANNYFEEMMGETANIRRQNVGFAHFLVLRGYTPYYLKNKYNLRGKKKNDEVISEKYLQKYIKLFKDMDFPHKPDLLGICLLDFDKNKKAKLVNLDDFDFSNETKKLLQNDFSLNNFLDKVVHLVNLKS
ncbi:MAG: hypothetical protein PHO56_03535 [Patescibacteria group bacterium]|nr:hypothetical protein [Patescibacteria group bacterium]